MLAPDPVTMPRNFACATRLLVIGAALVLVRLLRARRRESFVRGGGVDRVVVLVVVREVTEQIERLRSENGRHQASVIVPDSATYSEPMTTFEAEPITTFEAAPMTTFEAEPMTTVEAGATGARRIARLVTVGAIVCTLASGALAFAAGQGIPAPAAKPSAAPAEPIVLVVPDVRGQVYTFAKGMLEDAGFAWRVAGDVGGHAANSVVSQTPLPGTRVYDTGVPIVTLALERNSSYTEGGTPQNASPYPGTPVELVGGGAPAPAPARPPAFELAGAPVESADQPSLPERAQRLARWIETHRAPTRANAAHWSYEHAWIVAGARFGWWGGAGALETLIRVDRRVPVRWDMGWKRRAATKHVLADVRKASR